MKQIRVVVGCSLVGFSGAACSSGHAAITARDTTPASSTAHPVGSKEAGVSGAGSHKHLRAPSPPPLAAYRNRKPDLNESVACGRLPLPSAYYDSLQRPSCWTTSYGSVRDYALQFSFVAGSLKGGRSVVIWNNANGPIRQRQLSTQKRIETSSERTPFICLTVGRGKPREALDFITGSFDSGPGLRACRTGP